ncbi:hypothetical protein AB0J72_44750 [Dactylosporangium sp. NPDC049742]
MIELLARCAGGDPDAIERPPGVVNAQCNGAVGSAPERGVSPTKTLS